jgi:hypothetical protein
VERAVLTNTPSASLGLAGTASKTGIDKAQKVMQMTSIRDRKLVSLRAQSRRGHLRARRPPDNACCSLILVPFVFFLGYFCVGESTFDPQAREIRLK